MDDANTDYDPRYLGGILRFNERDFFEAHEVWESQWMNCAGPERRFIQGLIQAAVALYHFGNGNLRGAVKLFHSSRAYMEKFGTHYLGLDIQAFWRQMEECFTEALAWAEPDPRPALDDERIPVITLEPLPARWPDPAEFASEEN